MSSNVFAQYNNVVPLVQPIDLGTTDTATPYVQLKGCHRLAFLVQFGVTTEAATANIIDVLVECASVETVAETAIAFNYRLSSAVTANTWGAITAATATGAELNKNHEGMSLWIEIDPDLLGTSDYKFCRLNFVVGSFTAVFVSVVAFLDSRYKMTTMQSATAAASA